MRIKEKKSEPEKVTLPKVTFLIASYNEERDLPRLLGTIRNQDYPKGKVEIIVADANSQDKTREIARSFGAVVIINEKKHCEYGYLKAYGIAKGEVRFFCSCDNAFPDKSWIRKMVMPFIEDKEMIGAYCVFGIDRKDNSTNKYATMACDPFNNFIYGKGANIWQFPKNFPVIEKGSNWRVYDFSSIDYPLLCLDQGFALRKGYKRPKGSEFCDIVPIIDMLQKRQKIAHVTNTYMVHYAYNGFSHFIKKIDRKIANAITDTGKFGMIYRDRVYGSARRNIKKVLWVFYTLSVIGPVIYSVRRYMQFREPSWFYEFPVSMIMLGFIFKNVMREFLFRKHVEYDMPF